MQERLVAYEKLQSPILSYVEAIPIRHGNQLRCAAALPGSAAIRGHQP
jgi:hypothetical protein